MIHPGARALLVCHAPPAAHADLGLPERGQERSLRRVEVTIGSRSRLPRQRVPLDDLARDVRHRVNGPVHARRRIERERALGLLVGEDVLLPPLGSPSLDLEAVALVAGHLVEREAEPLPVEHRDVGPRRVGAEHLMLHLEHHGLGHGRGSIGTVADWLPVALGLDDVGPALEAIEHPVHVGAQEAPHKGAARRAHLAPQSLARHREQRGLDGRADLRGLARVVLLRRDAPGLLCPHIDRGLPSAHAEDGRHVT